MEKAKQLINENNIDAALGILQKLRKEKVDKTELIISLGEIYFTKKDYTSAEAELLKALTKQDYSHYTTEYEIRKMLAEIYLKTMRYDTAYEEYLMINRINPEDVKVLMDLALICMRTKRYKNALNHLEKYLHFVPRDAQAIFNMGCVYFEQDNFSGAEQKFLATLEVDPALMRAQYYLGAIYLQMQDYDKAIKRLELSKNDKEVRNQSYVGLAQAYYFVTNYAEAIFYLRKAKDMPNLEPDVKCQYLYYLGDAFYQVNNYKESLDTFQELLQIDNQYKDVKARIETLKQKKEKDVIPKFRALNKEVFEKQCIGIAEFMGYKVSEHNISTDGVVDIIAYKRSGRASDAWLIEIISTDSSVGELVLREMSSKMSEYQISRGLCISTSSFTPQAKELTEKRSIEIINKEDLEKILIDFYAKEKL